MSVDSFPPTTPAPAEVPPVTLREYYEGRIQPGRLFSRDGPEPVDAHDQTRLEALLADLSGVDSDLRKTVKLVSGRSKLPRWLQLWLKAAVERDIGCQLDPAETSRGLGLRRLFTRCQTALISKDAANRRRAYNLLRLSLVYVNSHSQLDPLALVDEATRLAIGEGQTKLKGRELERGAVAMFLEVTSPVKLKKVLLSLLFWIERARTARADVFTAEDKAERLAAKVDELRQDLAVAREQIRTLEGQAEDSAKNVVSLSRQLEVEHNKRINRMREAKGRVRRLFDSGLAPRLRGAREALDGGPVALDVALERLDRALELLEEERPWLSSD